MIAISEVMFSIKDVAEVGNGALRRSEKILAFLNSYLSNVENIKDAK